MEKDPLLPYNSPQWRPSPLFPLPEDDEISPSLPLTPSELKDILIFGASPSSSSNSSSFLQSYVQETSLPSVAPAEHSPSESCDLSNHWTRSSLHRSKTAPAMATIDDFVRRPAIPKPQFSSQSIIRQATILLLLYLSLGVTMYWCNRGKFSASETHPIVDALYFCIVTMCTIGYGDITPNSTSTKLFSILFVLVGFGLVDILLTGMVSYVLDLQESHMLRAAQDVTRGKSDLAGSIIDVKKGRMRIRMKVGLALGVVVLCIGVGAAVMHFVEKLGWVDSLYLSVMSVTTVGYGDHAFTSLSGRIFASIWLLVSTLAVARAFLYLAEARVDKRQRRLAKWVLGHDMTIAEFLAADMDNNGFVRCLFLSQ